MDVRTCERVSKQSCMVDRATLAGSALIEDHVKTWIKQQKNISSVLQPL